jgi:glycosyltransferase involved in cell wall biosynthesis
MVGMVLSRLSPEKNLSSTLGLGLTFIVRLDARNYDLDLSGESCLLDAPYEDCMERLRSAAFLVSTWTDETYGLNALEAAERGVPVILCEDDKPHASRTFLPEWGYLTCAPTPEGVRDAISRIPWEWRTLAFRERLAAYMRTVTP